MNHQVLFDAIFANTGEKFCVIGCTCGNLTYVERTELQLIEWDHAEVLRHCNHVRGGISSFRGHRRLGSLLPWVSSFWTGPDETLSTLSSPAIGLPFLWLLWSRNA